MAVADAAATVAAQCPVHPEFDPLRDEFLVDPFPESYSAATAQLPLVQLVPEVPRILAEGGHRPQPSMVSLDQPAQTRLRRPAARAFTPRRVAREGRLDPVLAELRPAGGHARGPRAADS